MTRKRSPPSSRSSPRSQRRHRQVVAMTWGLPFEAMPAIASDAARPRHRERAIGTKSFTNRRHQTRLLVQRLWCPDGTRAGTTLPGHYLLGERLSWQDEAPVRVRASHAREAMGLLVWEAALVTLMVLFSLLLFHRRWPVLSKDVRLANLLLLGLTRCVGDSVGS